MAFIDIKKSGFPKSLITVSLRFQECVKSAAKLIRITKSKLTHRFFAQPSAGKILISNLSAFGTKLIIIVLCSLLIDFKQFRSLLCFLSDFSGILNLRKLYSGSVCQMFQSFTERIILVFHNKIVYISSCATSETVIHLFARCHRKRRSLFIMKRTESKICTAPSC